MGGQAGAQFGARQALSRIRLSRAVHVPAGDLKKFGLPTNFNLIFGLPTPNFALPSHFWPTDALPTYFP